MIDSKLMKKAWNIIRRNYGCPGPDGLSWDEIKKNYDSYSNLLMRYPEDSEDYSSFYEKTIIDYRGNPRKIYIYNILYRWIQQYYKLYFQSKTDSQLLPNIYSYRYGKSLDDMRRDITLYYNQPCLIVDIKKFFDNVNIDILLEVLDLYFDFDSEELFIIRKLLYPCNQGIPQGNTLSPYLSNIYLYNLDMFLQKFSYLRYSDDMFIFIDPKMKTSVLREIKKILYGLNLELNQEKTKYVDKFSAINML